ncbi:zinc-binding dehydrogenase, partial [Acinetobacter baumannii]
SKDENLERVRLLGADEGINYKTYPNWEERVLELTDGKGADVTIEVAGGNGLNQSIAATKVTGTIAQVGFLTGQTTQLNLMPLIFR